MLWLLGLLLIVEIGRTNPSETITTTYLCPKDFHSIGEKCYYFGNNEVMWMDSHFYCQILNSSLSVINSYREQHLLRDFTNNNTQVLKNPERWIDGIYDWQQKRWKWGSSGQKISFNVFSRKNIGDENQWNCIALNGAKKNKWTSRKCTEKKGFICETDTNVLVQFKLTKRKKFDISKCSSGQKLDKYEKRKCLKLLGAVGNNEPAAYAVKSKPKKSIKKNVDGWVCRPHMISLGNRCYYFSNIEATWTDAHFECRKNESKLAIVRNRSQDHNLRRFLNNFIERQDRWIDGIYDWKTGQWKWALNGQPLTYKGFANEILKNKTPSDLAWNSIYMDSKLDNQWNIDKQTVKKKFICQVKAKAVRNIGTPRLKSPKATVTILKS